MAEEPENADSNIRFERRVLGAALVDAEAWDEISQKLTVDDFTAPIHIQLLQSIHEAEADGYWGDPTLIAELLARKGSGDDAYDYVADLVGEAIPGQTLPRYIETLKIHTNSRRMAVLAHQLATGAHGVHGDGEALEALLASADSGIQGITDDAVERPWVSVESLVADVEAGNTRMEANMPTGFPDLDRILQGGLRAGQMVVIAGRPATGKSTMALDIARHASIKRGIPGLFVSLEMSTTDLASRVVAAEGAVAHKAIVMDDLDDRDRARIREVSERVQGAPLDIIDESDSSWDRVEASIRAAHRKNKIEYAVVDYLQLCTGEGNNRQEVVSAISRRAKMLAKQLGIVMIALSQLNRTSENRTDKRPEVSDLRESGSIEQDADIIGLVYRPDLNDPLSERAGEADLIIGKQRNGPTGTASFAFQGHYSRFASLSYSENDHGGAQSYQES